LLVEAEQVFAPKKPKAVKAKADASNKPKPAAAKGSPKKETSRKKAAIPFWFRILPGLLCVSRQIANRAAEPSGSGRADGGAVLNIGWNSFRHSYRARLGSSGLMAYLPPSLPFVARRDGRSDEGAAGVDASRLNPNDDERLRKGDDRLEAQSEQPSCWAGLWRNIAREKGGLKHHSPSMMKDYQEGPFPIGG
jgi:hypothetical protein